MDFVSFYISAWYFLYLFIPKQFQLSGFSVNDGSHLLPDVHLILSDYLAKTVKFPK